MMEGDITEGPLLTMAIGSSFWSVSYHASDGQVKVRLILTEIYGMGQ